MSVTLLGELDTIPGANERAMVAHLLKIRGGNESLYKSVADRACKTCGSQLTKSNPPTTRKRVVAKAKILAAKFGL